MPHRADLESEERPGKGARQRGKGDNWQTKDSTGIAARNRAVATTPDERKSGPLGSDPIRALLLTRLEVARAAVRTTRERPGIGFAIVARRLLEEMGRDVTRRVRAAELRRLRQRVA